MRHVMILLNQEKWNKLWNSTPESRRVFVDGPEEGSPRLPIFRVNETYFVSCGSNEIVAEENAEQALAEAISEG